MTIALLLLSVMFAGAPAAKPAATAVAATSKTEWDIAAAEADAKARAEAREQAKRDRVGLAALLCAYGEARAAAKASIDRENRYSKIGGVVNATKLHAWQSQVGLLGDELARIRGMFRRVKVKPRTCSDALVSRLATCASISFEDEQLASEWRTNDECAAEDLRPYMVQ